MAQVRRAMRRALWARGLEVRRLDTRERQFLTELIDDREPLPASAAGLHDKAPRLLELRDLYRNVDEAARVHSRWADDQLWIDLAYFRGDNPYVWHYREGRQVSELKFLVYVQDVVARDDSALLEVLTEDGAFGCWTYSFDGLPRCSRDLLDSVNELLFLEAELGVLGGTYRRVLDIGAGYGRMAHRWVTAVPATVDYCCVDAIPESTFLCDYYLGYRDVAPPARALPLPELQHLDPGSFDLAMNIHSWSECPIESIEWWATHLARLEVPMLFLVPNEAEGFLSLEVDGSRQDYLPVLEKAGYKLTREALAIESPAVRAAIGVLDRYCLFERRV